MRPSSASVFSTLEEGEEEGMVRARQLWLVAVDSHLIVLLHLRTRAWLQRCGVLRVVMDGRRPV